MKLIKKIFITMRPKHWVKNILVFAALFFSVTFFDIRKDLIISITFVLFCLLSGTVYIINDIADKEEDKKHPKKSKRPIASGELGIRSALIAAFIFTTGSLIAGFMVNTILGLILSLYFTLNILYSFWLKRVFIIDILVIAFGIIMRALAGAVAIQVGISPWFVIATLFLAIFLALNKRKAELSTMKTGASNIRAILGSYTESYIDQLITIMTAAIIVSYALYSFNSVHSKQMLWTIPFVIYGVFRYIYLTEVKGHGGQLSDTLVEDRPLVICIVLWVITVGGILLYANV